MSRKVVVNIFSIVLFGLLVTGCAPDEPVIATEIANGIEVGVKATLTAQPTTTFLPTEAPWPTEIGLVTATPLATATIFPTMSPLKTATPYPTQTPYPTFTPTSTSISTATPLPVTVAAVGPPAGQNLDLQTLDAMLAAHTDVRLFRSLVLDAHNSGLADCANIMAAFGRVINAPIFDISNGSEEAQFAYGKYREAIQLFSGEADNPWSHGSVSANENCQNNGTDTGFSNKQNNDVHINAGATEHLLVDGILRLGGEV